MRFRFGVNAVRVDMLFAIALHETGGFKSSLWQRANNAVGMRKPSWSKRPIGVTNGYAIYRSGWSCAMDFFDWMVRTGCIEYTYGLWILTKKMKEKGYYTAEHEPYYNNTAYFAEKWKGKMAKLNLLAWAITAIVPTFLIFIFLVPKEKIKTFFKQWTSKKLQRL